MAKKPDSEGLQKHTLHLYSGDYERIRELYPDLGAAVVIRKIVRKFLVNIEDKARSAAGEDTEIKVRIDV